MFCGPPPPRSTTISSPLSEAADLNGWEVIGVVAGAGTTSAVQNYQFTDQSPARRFNLLPAETDRL
jgi:hypothetical protein